MPILPFSSLECFSYDHYVHLILFALSFSQFVAPNSMLLKQALCLKSFRKGLLCIVFVFVFVFLVVTCTMFSPAVPVCIGCHFMPYMSSVVRSDIVSLRSERDKLALDAKFARERLDSFMKDFEHQVKFIFCLLAPPVYSECYVMLTEAHLSVLRIYFDCV